MSHVPDISDIATSRLEPSRAVRLRAAAATRNGHVTSSRAPRVDSVELSPEARAADGPPVRADLVASIREQIESGTYDTDSRLNRAIDALVDELDA